MAVKVPPGAWVVVCDGRKVVILENKGDAAHPDLHTLDATEIKDPPTSAIGADRPGRVYQSVGQSRSAVEQTDWHDREEDAFLHAVAARLDAALAAGEVKSIVLVAPPRALGMIRKAYGPRLKEAIAAEIDKDLVAHPVHDIEKHLFG
jgi:protein required for attachment to host cells